MKQMKTLFWAGLFAGLMINGWAQEPKAVEPGEISFSVHKKIVSDESFVHRKKQSGDVELPVEIKTETQTCILEVEIKNLEDYEARFQVEWYFFGQKVSGSDNEPVLFDAGMETITLGSELALNKTFSSKAFEVKTVDKEHSSSDAHDEHSLDDYRPEVSGMQYFGHVLIVKSGGEILEIETDSADLMADDLLEQLLQTSAE